MKRKKRLTEDELFEIKAREYERGLRHGYNSRKPRITKEFVEKHSEAFYDLKTAHTPIEILTEILVKAGCEMEK